MRVDVYVVVVQHLMVAVAHTHATIHVTTSVTTPPIRIHVITMLVPFVSAVFVMSLIWAVHAVNGSNKPWLNKKLFYSFFRASFRSSKRVRDCCRAGKSPLNKGWLSVEIPNYN